MRNKNGIKSANQSARRHAGQAGLTIIELLVAVTLFSIVTGAVYGLLQVARADRLTTSQRVDLMRNLRMALNMMGRDALDAGFSYTKNGALLPDNVLAARLGTPADVDTTRDLLMSVVAGRRINTNSLNPNNERTDQISFVYRDVSFNSGQELRVTTFTESASNSGIVHATIDASQSVNGCTNGDLYLLSNQNSSALAVLTSKNNSSKWLRFAPSDALGINATWNNSPFKPQNNIVTAPATIKRVLWVNYRVLADGTLVRTVYGNGFGAGQDQPLAYGVESMDVAYVMQDGTVTNDPTSGTDGIAGTSDDNMPNLQLVRQVRITVTARSAENDRRTNQPFRITLSATFNTRNTGYDA